jgi:uncharacterized protein (DUF433 family)
LLPPEIVSEPRVIYSFRDVLALRTFVHLREQTSLQRIRKAVGSLRHLGEYEHLAAYVLLADSNGDIRFVSDQGAETELTFRPGQMRLVWMSQVIEPFPVRPGVVLPDLLRPRAHLSIDPETQGGLPVITGTRVPYDAVATLMRDVPAERISDYYPGVSAKAASDALDFAHYVDSYDPDSRVA